MKKAVLIILLLLLIITGAIFMLRKPGALFARETKSYSIEFMSKPPHDTPSDTSQLALAQFAWNEFLALNWRSSYESSGARHQRGEPDYGWNYSRDSKPFPDLAVWETYNHRVEFRPGNDMMLPFDKVPVYSYTSSSFPSEPGVDLTLFNNLDENNEIGSCNLYAYTREHGKKYQVLYQAKVNRDEYDYVLNHYNTAEKLKQANITTFNNIQKYNTYYQGAENTCDCPPSENVICLPCGTGSNDPGSREPEGSIEVKTAWRKKLPEDGKAETYFQRKILTYSKNADGTIKAINDTYLLIGLHIIHKTRKYPNFVFATWEHKDDTLPKLSMGYEKLDPPTYGGTIIAGYPRVSKVEDQVNQANIEAHRLLDRANRNSVWKYYNLIGVQAKTTNDSHYPNFFLANYVIESDTTLQIFRGSGIGTPIDSGENIVYNGKRYSMGGCQGCHGVAQFRLGSDLSFICDTVNKPVDAPDIGQTMSKLARFERALKMNQKGN
ncbi:hypothetical protein SAMN05428988_6098 [Chitinophaga sp. YR573]|uniref:hypothetical protein n=1 Tax=Chitinophaga sp. YR573 TaxID=1881040 RepID=UPI0008AAAAFD|nr:hypothetical protein [Chitinophaga sp. YR573]SEW45694.1 hypothetical protein SAMN05428988_6098 [Chitinophaga sp. YR573]